MAQWITRLPTEQKIAGSSPAEIGLILFSNHVCFSSALTVVVCIRNN